jgi:restriction endonuclease Mrr
MAAPSPENVTEWLTDEADNQSFKPLREVIDRVLTFRLQGKSPEDIAELSERLAPAIIEQLQIQVANDKAEGIASRFEISSEGEYFRILDAPELPMLTSLQNLDPTEFENFCARILKNLGANSARIGGSQDNGVDFVAINLQLGDKVKLAPRSSQGIVIGQAKRYKDKNITECDMREFIGGAVLRADILRCEHVFDTGLLSPVSFAYWTTSDFHIAAKKYARRMGIWYLNGIALAQLAQRAGVEIK